ncbi:MAG: ParB/RepB/Spo0J family partition protein [Firmicutes bacterium]|nr:ParB/RepB/Spo0J family partition protein [Bacillota bacterium]
MSDKLGRNFNDLIEENSVEIEDYEKIIDVNIRQIKPNPEQPRTVFDEVSLNELAESIKEHGVIQPVILKPTTNGYILVAGERRVKACKIAGLKTVPAIIREYNSIFLSEIAILENLQREDLTPIEEALAFQKALFNLKITHEELGKKIGKSRVYVTNMVGLLNLPASIIDDVNLGKISMGHARALSKLKDPKLCIKLRNRIVNENLNVRDIEKIIRDLSSNKETQMIPKEVLREAEDKMNNLFVSDISYKLKKNTLTLHFDTQEQLEKIIAFLCKEE